MSTLEALKRKIDTVEDLQSVVKTMKALAAVSIRQYEKAVVSLADYENTLTMGMQVLLKHNPQAFINLKPKDSHQVAVVVFGSDQGLCGQFNERLSEFVLEELSSLLISFEQRIVLTIGMRITDALLTAGQPSKNSFNLPSSLEGITGLVQKIVLLLEEWRSEYQVEQILVFYNRLIKSPSYRPEELQLYPLNMRALKQLEKQKWPSKNLPTFTMNSQALASALFRQYFFVSLYRACAESLASENASRLASMQIAEKNIAERLGELQMAFQQQRQTNITEELLDIVSGFESLTKEEKSSDI